MQTHPTIPIETDKSRPPTSILGRLRSTPGFAVFCILLAALPVLVIASSLGAAAMLRAPDPDFSFSSLTGKVRQVNERWQNLRYDDEILALDGVSVAGDSGLLRNALLDREPGPLEIRVRRAETGEELTFTASIEERGTGEKVVIVFRVLTGALLLLIGVAAVVLRPGALVSGIFFVFTSALAFHLLIYMALLRYPREAIVAENLGLYLASASGLHLFLMFPQSLLSRRRFALFFYIPTVAAFLTQIPLVLRADPQSYGLLAGSIQFSGIHAVLTTVGAVGLVILQFRRARKGDDAIASARCRAVLVGLLVGLLPPSIFNVYPPINSDVHWCINSLLILVFVGLVAWALVRHNALDVDRFTAAVLGYASTLAVLTTTSALLLVGIPSVLSQTAPFLRSSTAIAGMTASFFVLFSPLYRRIRGQVDQIFFRTEVQEDTTLRRLRALADAVRAEDLPQAMEKGLETAGQLHVAAVEIWLAGRNQEGDRGEIIRARTIPLTREDTPEEPVDPEGVLATALLQHGGGVEGLADRLLPEAAQQALWARELALAAPILVGGRLEGFIALGRKLSGVAFHRQDRLFLESIASYLAISLEHDAARTEEVGPYRLLKRLGTGGMAEVHLAEKLGPGGFELKVALKRLLPHLAEEKACVDMFLDEARIASQLRHRNVIHVYDIGDTGGTYYLAMEYLDGPSVARLLSRAKAQDLRFPPAVVVLLAVALLDALEYLHDAHDAQGNPLRLVHRDVKPNNLLLSRQGEIRLADFGIAKVESKLYQTKPGHARGTPSYMPPEQLFGSEVDARADLYAAGAVIYELLTGERAFPKTTGMIRPLPPLPSQKSLSLGDEGIQIERLDDFISTALAPASAERFATAAEMRAAFLQAMQPVVPASVKALAELIEFLVPEAGSRAGSTQKN